MIQSKIICASLCIKKVKDKVKKQAFISIDGTKIGTQYPPYIIAELSANHNGDIERAFKILEMAKECGANALKLQTYTADTITIDCARKREFMY